MTGVIKVNELQGRTTANDITVTVGATATQSLEQGLAKGWIHFDGGDTTPAANDSLNHSSITDNGTGDYSLTHTNAYSGTEYGILLTGGRSSSISNVGGDMFVDDVEPTTTVARINSWRQTNSAGESANDVPNITAAFFGSLA